jgi:hypothetical protein
VEDYEKLIDQLRTNETKARTTSVLVSLYLFLLIFFVLISSLNPEKKIPKDTTIKSLNNFFSLNKNKVTSESKLVVKDQELQFYKKIFYNKITALLEGNRDIYINNISSFNTDQVISFSIPIMSFFDVIEELKIKDTKLALINALSNLVKTNNTMHKVHIDILFQNSSENEFSYEENNIAKHNDQLGEIANKFLKAGVNQEAIRIGIDDSDLEEEEYIIFNFFLKHYENRKK